MAPEGFSEIGLLSQPLGKIENAGKISFPDQK